MSRERFDRRWKCTVDALDVSDLDLTFDVARDTTRAPNTAEIRIINLSRENRARLAGREELAVRLRAGYATDGDPPPIVFAGSSRDIYVERDGTDIVTVVQASDSGQTLQRSRIRKSYAAGTPIVNVLRDAVTEAGIGEGNLSEFENRSLRNGATTFPDGYVADGPARRIITTILRAAGLRWSVQNGALQVLEAGTPLQTRAPILEAGTGLVGTPTRGENGKVTAQVLIQPGLEPGRRVVLRSAELEGSYEIRQTVLRGATAGLTWYAILDLAAL